MTHSQSLTVVTTMMRRIAPLILAAGLCGGCGVKPAEVSGSVVLDGRPLANANVQFIPTSDPNLGVLVAKSDEAGKFSVRHDAADAPAKPGSYVVLISKTTPVPATTSGGMETQKEELPAVYQDRNRSPLKAEIVSGPSALQPFVLNNFKMGN